MKNEIQQENHKITYYCQTQTNSSANIDSGINNYQKFRQKTVEEKSEKRP